MIMFDHVIIYLRVEMVLTNKCLCENLDKNAKYIDISTKKGHGLVVYDLECYLNTLYE